MPGLIRTFRFLERLFPQQSTATKFQPNSVSNEITLTNEIMKPGLVTGFRMGRSIVNVTAGGGIQTISLGLEPNAGEFTIPIWAGLQLSSATAELVTIQFADSGIAPDVWGRWGFESADLPQEIISIATRTNIMVTFPLPIVPRGLQVDTVGNYTLGDVMDAVVLFLRGPSELLTSELFRALGSTMRFTSSI